MAKGVLGAGVFNTDDCRGTYEELKNQGVVFVSEPAERPYGIEAVFKDNTGNWFSLTQPNEGHK
jgi:predicted enzyme related to lactoylglutathione lyase